MHSARAREAAHHRGKWLSAILEVGPRKIDAHVSDTAPPPTRRLVQRARLGRAEYMPKLQPPRVSLLVKRVNLSVLRSARA